MCVCARRLFSELCDFRGGRAGLVELVDAGTCSVLELDSIFCTFARLIIFVYLDVDLVVYLHIYLMLEFNAHVLGEHLL